MVPDLFAPDALREVQDWLAHRPVILPDGRSGALASLPPGTATAPYALSAVLDCPHVLERVNDPAMLALAQRYLGCKPTLSSIGIRWSLPTPARPSDVQRFHRDPDDWRFLKLFVYLTDVDAASGPHVYAAASHRARGSLRARLWTRQEVEGRFGAAALVTVAGRAGTSFMADTYGVHAGGVPVSQPRLILQAQYSVLPVYAFRYEPARLARTLYIDSYVNRLILLGAETGESSQSGQAARSRSYSTSGT
jgi:hypothetical protein